ncbi:MAG TPA: ABC transporter permease [Actinomycetota bacterium]|nr:ABC transporter permease [Actinomycetota bacterium]
MNIITETVRWFADASHWSGSSGVPARLLEHLQISFLAVAVAAVIALPVGLFIGHTRRGEFLAVSVGNLGRALPSFGILALVFPLTLRYAPGSIGFAPTLIALFLLAIPPILTNTYVGVQNVDPDVTEAARGMGLSGREVLFQLEVPLAARLIVAGLRTAAVQVVATATLGAVFAWGGLGRFIVDGFAQGDDGMIVAGALLVAAVAILTEVAFTSLERVVTPRASSARRRTPETEASLIPRQAS